MFIPQTSLIPATVALLKFYQLHGFSSFFQNYPYWYFGEVSYKYLIGPITPILLNSDILINNLSYIVLVLILTSSIGWALFFVAFFKPEKRFYIFHLSFIILLLGPFKYLYTLAITDFTSFFAKSLIPFFLIFLYKKKYILSILFLVFLLLINTNALPSVLVFSFCLSIKNYKTRLKPFFVVLVSSLLASSVWYGPLYYLKILMNPSIGGRVGLSAIWGALNFFKLLLPVVIAFVAVKMSGKLRRRLPIFIVGSIISFLTLSIYRFFANPDFWMDWITWFYELEISLSLLMAYAVYKKLYKYIVLSLFSVLCSLLLFFRLNLGNKNDMTILSDLEKIAGTDRVFMSGSTVFQPSELNQLRGGRDEVIKNSDWLIASYIFRESKDTDLIKKNLSDLKIKFVLVHTKNSKEYYHDFKNEEVWQQIGEKVFEQNGDVIYKVN